MAANLAGERGAVREPVLGSRPVAGEERDKGLVKKKKNIYKK